MDVELEVCKESGAPRPSRENGAVGSDCSMTLAGVLGGVTHQKELSGSPTGPEQLQLNV